MGSIPYFEVIVFKDVTYRKFHWLLYTMGGYFSKKSALHVEESTMTNIETLLSMPEELLLQIFGHLEYRDIVSVGMTCKQWHHLSQDKVLMEKIKSRDFTPETWPNRNDTLVPYLNISSTGPTADGHSEVLGLYALVPGTRHGGKPVYQQMDGEYAKYKVCYDSDNQVWTVVVVCVD